jgi:hypothetical protein
MSHAFSQEAYSKTPRESLNGYNLDKSLSNKKTLTYHNPETKQTYIAHRGTDPRDKKDLKNDFLITTGLLNKYTSKRVRNAEKIAKGAQAKYGSNITNTGHSLGATMAEKTGKKLNVENSKVVGYNPGMSPLDIPKGMYQKAKSYFNPNSESSQKLKNVTRHTTGVDPISMSGMVHAGKTVLHKPKQLNVHGLSNFS